jgi:hypothetical protein
MLTASNGDNCIGGCAMAERRGAGIGRRGILAAAGAAHQPEDLGLGITNSAASPTVLRYTGPFGADAILTISDTTRPTLFPACAIAGMSRERVGIFGFSDSSIGVFGRSFGYDGAAGTVGVGGLGIGGNTYGVVGATEEGSGGVGVAGEEAQFGVLGRVRNADNTIAVYGDNTSTTGTNNIGVAGHSFTGPGVQGLATQPNLAGCLGVAFGTNGGGIVGVGVPGAYAARFFGPVLVEGDFTVVDPTRKHGAIKHADGSYRTLYSMESPESWLEDFGEGRLSGGKAEIPLARDFVAVARTDAYFVFLTARGETNGLYVAAQAANGFTVQERGKGQSDAAFYWRVVARPQTDRKAPRLARIEVPQMTVPSRDDLPKPPPPAKIPDMPQKP